MVVYRRSRTYILVGYDVRLTLSIFLSVVVLLVATSAKGSISGVSAYGSKTEEGIGSFILDRNLKLELGIFHLKNGDTDMYGMMPNLGYRFLSRKYVFTYLVGEVGGGVTVSPKPQLPSNTYRPIEDNNSYGTSIMDQIHKAMYDAELWNINHLHQSVTNADNYLTGRAVSVDPYGAAMFYDVGVEEKFLISDDASFDAFGGYRWPHGHHVGNVGDLNTRGFLTRIGVSLVY